MTGNKTVTGYRIKHERALSSTAPIKGVTVNKIANKTPIARVHGKIKLTCPVCFIEFERYACHVVRRGQTAAYCGKGCADFGRRQPCERSCVVCGKKYIVARSSLNRVVTCSRECLRIKRTWKRKKAG